MSVPEKSPEFVRLLDHLKVSRGFDFTGYKVSSLMRRVAKRMAEVGVASYEAYTDYLEVHPDEFQPLFNTVLINVTSFFRDRAAWDFVAAEVVPHILDAKASDAPVRAWSAGCSAGQEAYTLAMVLAEALGEEAFRERVKIYATDADEDALASARHGGYDERQVDDIPPELRERYFERSEGRFVFRADLRRALIFGRHDLVQDAAISRLDLLVCRNTLMYFDLETQAKILARFHFALNPNGYLFLGKAETLLAHHSFRPVDLKHRVFQRVSSSGLRERLLAALPVAHQVEAPGDGRQARLRQTAFDSGPWAQVVVDRKGHLALANERARRLLGLGPDHLGRLLQDLELSYRPAELRSPIEEAYRTRGPVRVPEVPLRGARGETTQLEVQVVPLFEETGSLLGASVSFMDVTEARQLRAELEGATQELETTYEELQSANEELETTNEELQSTIEELETTNEELQSANEELETMNEELQSTNEELRTMNEQLHERSADLDLVNGRLHSILAGLPGAVVVVNRALEVEVWSRRAEELWGLRSDEALGRPFLKLDFGLPVERLQQPIRDSLDGGGGRRQSLTLDGVDRRGRPLLCEVTVAPLGHEAGGREVLLHMEEKGGG